MGGIFSSPSAIAAFVATGLISLAPNVLLLLMPRYASGQGGSASTFLSLGQAMGAGGLIGDVFLHTLPEIHYNETSGMFILIGFVFFLAADLLCRSTSSDDHHHHHTETKTQFDGAVIGSPEIPLKKSAIILNLFADSLHNYTDGLAIGASYSIIIDKTASTVATAYTVWSTLKNHSRGGFAALSICFHEIPHELSDFCTLVRAGYSTRQAILAQFFTAVAAFIGTATAIAVSADNRLEEPIILFTAGGFIYLAGTTILPEVLNEEGGGNYESKPTVGLFRFAKLVAFCVGILFLSMVDWLNGDDHHHHHHHENAPGHTHEHFSGFREGADGSHSQMLHQQNSEL